MSLAYRDSFEFLPRPFAISPGVTLPVGGYDFRTADRRLQPGPAAAAVGEHLAWSMGTFYNGDKTTLNVARGRAKITNRSCRPSRPTRSTACRSSRATSRTHLFGSRVTYTVTPMMFVSALVQYNSDVNAVSTNARLRWEYQPGSELFVVYNEERNTLAPGFPNLANRAFIVKFNRLFRF